jgi:hypothetical protein
MKRKWAFVALSLCLFGLRAWAAEDPQIGRWKLDLTKSKYVTATAPRSSVATVTPYGKDGVNLTVNMVNAKGEAFVIQYSAEYDGKPYPRTESGPGAIAGQTVRLRRVDSRTVERIVYLAGKPVGTERWAISEDGKTRTVTQSGTDSKGKPIDNVQVYVRQ